MICKHGYAQPLTEWVRIFPDTGNFHAIGGALSIDDSGNVFVGGYIYNNGNSLNGFCTLKYSPTGTQQWVSTYFGNNSGGRGAGAIALDKFSNVYVTGDSYENGDYFDYCTIKYNSNGIQQWIRYYDDSFHNIDWAEKIAVDRTGNIYVSGYSTVTAGGANAFTTIKYSPDGDTLWTRTYPQTGSVVHVNDIKTDSACNIYITGQLGGVSLTIKYDSSGSQLWAQIYSGIGGPGGTWSKALALDNNNNAFITGLSCKINNTENEYFTIKYSSDGTELWVRRYSIDTTSISNNEANSISADNAGNVYVSGFTRMNESSHMKPGIVKYSGNGEQLWVRIDSSSLSSQSTYMDIDKNNNIYILGSVAKPPLGYSYTTIKYDSSGAIQWQKHDLQTSFGTYPFCIKLDNQSNVYLTGYSGSKMNTLKYSQPQVGINNSNIQTPNSFKLFQNFPNPFNPSTYIKYQMIKDSYVQLILFDVLGRELETLINERQKAGIHKLMWDASKYPSGVYFYKLVTDKYSETRKMVFIK